MRIALEVDILQEIPRRTIDQVCDPGVGVSLPVQHGHGHRMTGLSQCSFGLAHGLQGKELIPVADLDRNRDFPLRLGERKVTVSVPPRSGVDGYRCVVLRLEHGHRERVHRTA